LCGERAGEPELTTATRIARVPSDVLQGHARTRPPDPTSHVQSKPGGGGSLPRLLLVKPDGTGDEPLDGPWGQR